MSDFEERMRQAVSMTAPGTALRTALDMIIAARLGALICIGDTERVLATGNDGFPLSIAFTSHRLFELSKMDGAIVIDEDLSTIQRANFHLSPDPTLPTSETGMRHRTAARMSMATDAVMISVSERRAVINVYIAGKNLMLRQVTDIMNEANQMLSALQSERNALDNSLVRLTSLEFDDYVTLADITHVLSHFQTVVQTTEFLNELILQLGSKGKVVKLQKEELTAGIFDAYDLTVRDYAKDPSQEEAQRIRTIFSAWTPRELNTPEWVAQGLGYGALDEDAIITPLGIRTLSRVSSISNDTAALIAEAFGSLPALINTIALEPDRLKDFGVSNPSLVVDSLYRMWGKRR